MNAVRLASLLAVAAVTMVCFALPFADLSSAEVDNDQGTVTYYTYTVDFQFQGTDAQWILWDFGFNDSHGDPVTSDVWNPSGIVFPDKGTYTVTQTVGNTVGTYVSQLRINIMGTPEVTFDSNGGSEVPMQTVKVSSKATQPVDPTKEGYSFVGWYKEQSLLNRYNFDQPVSQHMTLYAKWTVASSTEGNGENPGNDNPEPGNGEEPNDDSDHQSSDDVLPFDSSYLIIAAGGVIAYLGYRYGSRNSVIVGLIIAIAGAACLFEGFDILGLFGGE